MAQTKEQNHAPAPAQANASGEKRPRTSRRPHYTRAVTKTSRKGRK